MTVIRHALMILSVAFSISACQTTDTALQTSPNASSTAASSGKLVVGKARMASFRAPEECEVFSPPTMRLQGIRRVRTGCVLRTGDTMMIVGLNETTIPFGEAFKASGGDISDLQAVVTAFPRETLSEYLLEAERTALSTREPGWRYSNQRTQLLPGDGGVDGAAACLQFSFDGKTTSPPTRLSKVFGLRCARFGNKGATIEEVMIEAMAFSPAGTRAPAMFSSIAQQATSSLQYRR